MLQPNPMVCLLYILRIMLCPSMFGQCLWSASNILLIPYSPCQVQFLDGQIQVLPLAWYNPYPWTRHGVYSFNCKSTFYRYRWAPSRSKLSSGVSEAGLFSPFDGQSWQPTFCTKQDWNKGWMDDEFTDLTKEISEHNWPCPLGTSHIAKLIHIWTNI